MDAGTMESLLDAADFVRMIESRQGVVISAPEEVAFRNGWISAAELEAAADRYGKSLYGQHLRTVAGGRLISRIAEKRRGK